MIILRYKGIICGVLSIILLAGFLSEPKLLIQGAAGGMLLCAEDAEGNLALMTPEKTMPAGAEIC